MDTLEFERKKICYENNCKHAISLNTQLFQVPTITMTLTGGLWFGAGAIKDLAPEVRFGLLLFACFSNIAMTLVIIRIRDVFQSYLDKIKEFDPESFISPAASKNILWLQDYSMVSIFCILMLISALFSAIGSLTIYWPFEISNFYGIFSFALVALILYNKIFKTIYI